MKVLVLGGGIIGVSTAWYLLQNGLEVTLLERASGVANETSYANAGQLSYGYTTPWAAPGIPQKALKWLFRKDAPLIVRPDGSLFQLRWLSQMLSNCNEKAYRQNKARMVRISNYSQQMLNEIKHLILPAQYEGRERGTLQIFRTPKEMAAAHRDLAVLKEWGVPVEVISNIKDLTRFEPALSDTAHSIAGAFHLPQDQTGDCHLFAQCLAALCESHGARLMLNTNIRRLHKTSGRISHVETDHGDFTADAYVCAMGSFSRQALEHLNIRLPVYPVKGYSITTPVLHSDKAPVSTVLDETYKVAITRFDARIRVGGMAELSGYRKTLDGRRQATLSYVLKSLFPAGADFDNMQFWTGLRPMTPDGTPIIGATCTPNLWLNTGHGTLGWTMALGSGKIVADLVAGKTPDIETTDLSLARYV